MCKAFESGIETSSSYWSAAIIKALPSASSKVLPPSVTAMEASLTDIQSSGSSFMMNFIVSLGR